MGTYIVQSDIENVYGTTNVAMWSQLDSALTTADTTRIAGAIRYAEAIVDDRFRGSRYTVPLTGSTAHLAPVVDWCSKLAGIWLYESRGLQDGFLAEDANRVTYQKVNIHREIDAYLSGRWRGGFGLSEQARDAPVAVQ